jgi:hypothetical protein
MASGERAIGSALKRPSTSCAGCHRVIAWERIMRGRQGHPSAVRRRLAALRSRMKHLVRHGHLSRNHEGEIERPAINREEGTTLALLRT